MGTDSRVYVDAKILNMHDQSLPHEAYVGYIVGDDGERKAKRVSATESDDAEVLAVLYAIGELKEKLGAFTVVCDHQSVVSEANRDIAKHPSEHMEELRRILRENKSIRLEALRANPAHGVVTEFVNSQGKEAPGGNDQDTTPSPHFG